MRQLMGLEAVLGEACEEVARLVGFRAEPHHVAVVEHGVEQHQPLDHPAARRPPPVPVVGLPDERVETLVVHVEVAALMQPAGTLFAL